MSDEHSNETYRSLLSIAMEALRSLLILNGGAIVAILTYLGHLADTRSGVVVRARYGLAAFTIGLVFAMLGFLFAYMTQHALLNEGYGRSQRVPHQRWQWTGFIAASMSLLSFIVGTFAEIHALAG